MANTSVIQPRSWLSEATVAPAGGAGGGGPGGVPPRGGGGEEPDPQAQADPEAAVGAERGGAERVPAGELPHAGRELYEPAVGEAVAEPCPAGGVGHPARCLGRQKNR